MLMVGVAVADITPEAGLAMAGYAARSGAAIGAHDNLTVRALVINDTALVSVDVIGIDASMSTRIRSRCQLPDTKITILATHTHGGPVSMRGRLSAQSDETYLLRLENVITSAIDTAVQHRRSAHVFGGNGEDPGYARNRREKDGPVDRVVPVLRFDDTHGEPIAILTSYACHPVVLGADNRQWTADYLYFAREALEVAYSGAIALVVTGCAGDVNTGHSAAASLSSAVQPERSFRHAKVVGEGIAASVIAANLTELAGGLGASEVFETLRFELRETEPSNILAQRWYAQDVNSNPIARIWADWAAHTMGNNLEPMRMRCTALFVCGALIIALPGEIFAQTALDIRDSLALSAPLFVLSYGDDNPGYIPPYQAYQSGGYEVDEAHRFYGLGAAFAPGSAEQLAHAGCRAARMAESSA